MVPAIHAAGYGRVLEWAPLYNPCATLVGPRARSEGRAFMFTRTTVTQLAFELQDRGNVGRKSLL